MRFDINDKKYSAAEKRGYLAVAKTAPADFEMTFVGQYLCKYPNRLKELDIMREVTGTALPDWNDLTERNLKNFRDIVKESLSGTSAKACFARIKSILNDMKEEVTLPCKRFAEILVAKSDPAVNTYLTEEEIKQFEKVETRNDKEQYVKCLFLISSYTGARHSDALTFTEDNIQDGTLSYVSIKTHILARVPAHKNLVKCINGYNKSVSLFDCQYNDILRTLCMRAKINAKVMIHHGGVDKSGFKYAFVASHTARRSFVTNLYLRGVDLESIAKLCGHADSTMTKRYLCATRGLSDTAMSFFN